MRNKDCELCNGSGWYGDNGPGIRGNREYVPCEHCNPKADGDYAVLGDGWRDARKEYPEHDNDVLVYCDGCGGEDYYSLGKYVGGQWADKFDTCVMDAIGWVELPDPPAFA